MARWPRPSWLRAVVIAAAILTAVPVGGVLWVALFPPLPTILMLRQAVRGEGLDYQWRGLKQISPHLIDAAIAAEDARFCSHHGFDMEAIQKALDHNAEGGRIRGGSTITQQTAKNVFLWPSRDWIRKGLEAGYTVLIETVWSKRRIMEVYRHRIETHTRTDEDDAVLSRKIDEIERRLWLAGLAAERDELGRMARARQLDEVTARRMIREVDLQELRYL